MTNIISGTFKAMVAGVKQLPKRRMTMRYPDVQIDLRGYYTYDPKLGVAKAGYKGRHILWLDKCTGCQLCSIACENISQAIEMVKVSRAQPNNKKSIFPQVDYAKCVFCGLCIDPQTPVMTNPGLKTIQEISIGDKVLTHTGEYKPVTKIWDMRFTGQLYRIYVYGKPEPLICTSDHPIVAVLRRRSRKKDGRLLRVTEPLQFFKPGMLKRGDYLVSPIPKKEIPIEIYTQEISLYKRGNVKKLLELAATGDLFRLVGYYLSEGHCESGRVVNFSFHLKETYLVQDCASLLKHYFGKSATIKRNGINGVRVVLYSASAVQFFSQFGIGVENKKIQDWAFFAESTKQVQLIRGFWLGDGCRIRQPRQSYLNFTTTSRVLAFQLQQILGRLGIVATLEMNKNVNKRTSYHIDVFGKWAIRLAELMKVDFTHSPSKHTDKFLIDSNYIFMPIRKIEASWVENHRVMDVTVDDDHTFAPVGLATSNCVDACPFYALGMTPDFNLVSTSKKALVYSPEKLAVPPSLTRPKVEFKIEQDEAYHD